MLDILTITYIYIYFGILLILFGLFVTAYYYIREDIILSILSGLVTAGLIYYVVNIYMIVILVD